MILPTILIPGIKGTTLANTNTLGFDTIWSGIQSKYESIEDLELQLDPRYDKMPRSIIERSDVEDLAYGEIARYIKEKTESNLYIFGYDWRHSCRENGYRLKNYIEHLKRKLGTNKFNFVTHSMGGLVFSCYLNELNKNYNTVAHAVMTVCPFQGAVNALIALIVGEGGMKFPLFNSNDRFRKIARSFPAAYELCPVYKDAVAFDLAYRKDTPFDIYDPDHWQGNISDSEIFVERLKGLKAFRIDKPAMLNLSELDTEIKKRILIIAGSGEKTNLKVIVKKNTPDKTTNNFFDFNQKTGDGDGTVPLGSATAYKNDILTLKVKSKWYDHATHGFFLNDGRVQTIIGRFLLDDIGYKEWWSDIAGSVKRVR